MALGAVLAAALTDHSPRARGLYVAGVDVVRKPGGAGGYGVALGSVVVTESGPGAASSMTFTIDDPAIEILINDGDEIRFHDLVNDVPTFLGWVQSWRPRPAFGNQGRTIDVQAIGVDAIPDWAVTTVALTFPGNPTPTDAQQAVQSIVANCAGTGPLRALYAGTTSTQAAPTGRPFAGAAITGGVTIPIGTTMREAIRMVYADVMDFFNGSKVADVTVDMTYGLRTFVLRDIGRMPLDWTTLTINDVVAGPIQSEALDHEIDATAIIRGVLVTGALIATPHVTSDGTGKIGQIAVLRDDTVTPALADVVGRAYLSQFAVGLRGGFSLSDHSPTFSVHAGGIVIITDVQAIDTGATFLIGTITKTFTGLRETWAIDYGGRRPSAMSQLRRLTRSTLS